MNKTVPMLEAELQQRASEAEAAYDLCFGAGKYKETLASDGHGAIMASLKTRKETIEASQAPNPEAEKPAPSLMAQLAAITDPRERGKFLEQNEAGLLAEGAAQAKMGQADQGGKFPLTAKLEAITDPRERGRFIDENENGLLAEQRATKQ